MLAVGLTAEITNALGTIPVSTGGMSPRDMTATQILHMATGNPYRLVEVGVVIVVHCSARAHTESI